MISTYILSEKLIDLELVTKALKNGGLCYEVGYNDDTVWVASKKKKTALVIENN